MKRLRPAVPLLLLVLLVLGSVIYFGFIQPEPAPAATVLEGEVTFISPSWTLNGDGNIAINAEAARTKSLVVISVVGVATPCYPTTALKMKDRFIQNLLHRRVRVIGTYLRRAFIAQSIEQLD